MTKQPNQSPADPAKDASASAPTPAPAPATEGERAAEGAKPIKVIKRYSNRKLYDTERSKYVTLDEISRMIKLGEEIRIIDNESKEDLTSVTLTQIIYEEEKRESRMPLSMLRNLIQSSGATLQEFFDRSVKTPVAEAQKSVGKSVEELKQSAVNLRDAATHRVSELTDSAKRMYFERKAEEFKRNISHMLDEVEERLSLRIEYLRSDEVQQPQEGPEDEEAQAEEARPGLELREAHHVRDHAALLKERLEKLRALVEELERLDRR